MVEKCPLSNINWAMSEEVPEICQEQCGPIWDHLLNGAELTRDEFPHQDAYDSECRHLASEFSHEVLQVLGNEGSAKRIHQIVDTCMSCTAELGSDNVTFTCPFAKLQK